MPLLYFLCGALATILTFYAVALFRAAYRIHRTNREWTLLHERGDIPTWLYDHLRA